MPSNPPQLPLNQPKSSDIRLLSSSATLDLIARALAAALRTASLGMAAKERTSNRTPSVKNHQLYLKWRAAERTD